MKRKTSSPKKSSHSQQPYTIKTRSQTGGAEKQQQQQPQRKQKLQQQQHEQQQFVTSNERDNTEENQKQQQQQQPILKKRRSARLSAKISTTTTTTRQTTENKKYEKNTTTMSEKNTRETGRKKTRSDSKTTTETDATKNEERYESEEEVKSRSTFIDTSSGLTPVSATSALQGLMRRLGGTALEELLPPSVGGRDGPSAVSISTLIEGRTRLKTLLLGLKSDNESQQLECTMELCDYLSIATEDSLAGFAIDQFVPALINLLNYEHNPDMMHILLRKNDQI